MSGEKERAEASGAFTTRTLLLRTRKKASEPAKNGASLIRESI